MLETGNVSDRFIYAFPSPFVKQLSERNRKTGRERQRQGLLEVKGNDTSIPMW